MATTCPICERRRGKRFCPGLSRSRWAGPGKGETICAQCCGAQRETTIDCPADCPYLVAAHRYEAQRPRQPKEMAFPKVSVTEAFLEANQNLLVGLSLLILRQAEDNADIRDGEVLEALDALARGYQTLESGLYYEQPPTAPAALALYTALVEFLKQHTEELQKRTGASLRPADVLRAVVFLRRLGQLEGNGRARSRRYLNFLRRQLPAQPGASSEPRLIVPGA